MSGPSETPWSDNPNAPQIPTSLYVAEKENFAGLVIGLISYGIVVSLFFRCIGVLFSPANPIKKSIKWALVAHTVAMFSILTLSTAVYLNDTSIIYIDNREFPGSDEYPPGPIGYFTILYTKATTTLVNCMFPLNQWLADGLLLHRCYVIYSMNRWVMVFPCLIYLASVATGIARVYQESGTRALTATAIASTTSYISISLSLNVILTLMIVARLLVHIRDVRKNIGTSDGSVGLQSVAATIATMLIESYAIYAATLLLYVVPVAVNSGVASIFAGAAAAIQVIAPYLIIIRVANRRALTSKSIAGTGIGSMHFRSQGTLDGDGILADGDLVNSMEVDAGASGELGAVDQNAIEDVPL